MDAEISYDSNWLDDVITHCERLVNRCQLAYIVQHGCHTKAHSLELLNCQRQALKWERSYSHVASASWCMSTELVNNNNNASTALLTGRYARPGTRVARAVRAGDGKRVTSRVFTVPRWRWPYLTARTPVTSLPYPDRLLSTNTTPGPCITKKTTKKESIYTIVICRPVWYRPVLQ